MFSPSARLLHTLEPVFTWSWVYGMVAGVSQVRFRLRCLSPHRSRDEAHFHWVLTLTQSNRCRLLGFRIGMTYLNPIKVKGSYSMTTMGDLVLIHFEDKPMSFARVEDIQADNKPGWFHIKLLMLQVPLQVVSWILRDVYIEGDEFTMNGNRMRLEKVVSPELLDMPEEVPLQGEAPSKTSPPAGEPGSAKVISLTDRKRS